MRWWLAILLWSSVLWAEPFFFRVNRPFHENIELFEAAFFTRVPRPDMFGPNVQIVDAEWIIREILAVEAWKFVEFEHRNFLSLPEERSLTASIRDIESLLKHDDIIILYQWEPYERDPKKKRHPVAMIAFKRLTSEPDSSLLLEDLNSIHIERPEILTTPVPETIPHHWRPDISMISKTKRYFGDIIQINSLVIERRLGRRFLNYLYGLAYWHGILTTGRVIAEGQTIKIRGTEIRGPAVLVPTYYVGEGYGIRGRVYENLNFGRLPVNGRIQFSSRWQPNPPLSIMISNWNQFTMQLPATLLGNFTRQTETFTTFMGPLAIVPMEITGKHMRGIYSLDPQVERMLRTCRWDLVVQAVSHEIPQMPKDFPSLEAAFHFGN